MKKLLAGSAALALIAGPAMAGEVGTNVKTRTYSETGSRTVSYTGNTVENDFELSASASGTGATATATGTYVSGSSPLNVSGTATAPGGTSLATASVNVDSYELSGGLRTESMTSTFTDSLTENISSSFSF